MVEQADRRALRLEQGPDDGVLVEQIGQRLADSTPGRDVALQKRIAKEIGTAVDKARNADQQQIAAETDRVEDMPVEPGLACGLYGGRRGDVAARRDAAPVERSCR